MTDEQKFIPPKKLSDYPTADEIIREFLRTMEHGTPINWKAWKDVMIKAQQYVDRKKNDES